MQTISPLRYPGGKAKLYQYVKDILIENSLDGSATYIEPFAGGAGLAIKLLFNGNVKRVIINDLDPAIYCLWFVMLNKTEEFCNLIDEAELTVDEWREQKRIYKNSDNQDILKFGFSAFYLNRTNISGVIKGGVIGGLEQKGSYKIDARFNKERLKTYIREIAKKKDKITILNMDANDLMNEAIISKYNKVFVFFDPPYVKKGAQLYQNSFNEVDHTNLYKTISKCTKRWITTYDMSVLIEDLYSKYKSSKIRLGYSVKTNRKENELIFFSNNLKVPQKFLCDTFVI